MGDQKCELYNTTAEVTKHPGKYNSPEEYNRFQNPSAKSVNRARMEEHWNVCSMRIYVSIIRQETQ